MISCNKWQLDAHMEMWNAQNGLIQTLVTSFKALNTPNIFDHFIEEL